MVGSSAIQDFEDAPQHRAEYTWLPLVVRTEQELGFDDDDSLFVLPNLTFCRSLSESPERPETCRVLRGGGPLPSSVRAIGKLVHGTPASNPKHLPGRSNR